MPVKYTIIDNDPEITSILNVKLNQRGDYDLVVTRNPSKLLDVIISRSPDLIFINVDRYADKDFYDLQNLVNDLYRSFDHKPFIVALAGSTEKAYQCIKNNFFDYLVKPIDDLGFKKFDFKLRLALGVIANRQQKLCLQTYSDYRFIEIDEILYLKADNNRTEFFLIDKTKITVFRTLKHYETVLPNFFCRIHQSFIINQNYISRINLGKSECYLKPLKIPLPFSKSYKNFMTVLAVDLSSKSLS